MSRRVALAAALAASLWIILAAPFVGQLRGAIQAALPGQYRTIILAIVAGAVGLAIAWAAVRIRERRLLRYGLIAAAVASAGLYTTATATGNADVDAVERFHFVEYGVLTVLFHRVWRQRHDPGALVLPLTAAFIVGTLDEGVQWFVPGRIGEMRDVWLNGVAILCGLVFGLGLDLPPRWSWRLDRDGRSAVIAGLGAMLVTGGVFFYTVHVGHEIRDPAIGVFRSRFSAGELREAARERAARWQVEPPVTLRRFSREDQYLAEGIWHVQRRNEMEGEGGVWATWKENLILEQYFAPVLDFPTYATPSGARWPQEQRDNAAAAGSDARPFVSDAHPFPIHAWRRP
jgi:hypothetical protein